MLVWLWTSPPAQRRPDALSLTVEQQTAVDWAVDRFAAAHLQLPPVTVRFDPSREACGHQAGRYQLQAGEHVVTVCVRDSLAFAADLQRRRTLLHEFAHVWESANLSSGDRVQLAAALGAESWYDDDRWSDRGAERLAEAFVLALLDQPRRQLLVEVPCADLLGAFIAATNSAPLGPDAPTCHSDL